MWAGVLGDDAGWTRSSGAHGVCDVGDGCGEPSHVLFQPDPMRLLQGIRVGYRIEALHTVRPRFLLRRWDLCGHCVPHGDVQRRGWGSQLIGMQSVEQDGVRRESVHCAHPERNE